MIGFTMAAALLSLAVLVWILRPVAGSGSLPLAGKAVIAAALLVSLPVYVLLGTPAALSPAARVAPAPAANDLPTLTQQLAARLAEQPNDANGWLLLGRSKMTLGDHAGAAAALQEANALMPQTPQVMVELAEASAFASGQPQIPDASLRLLEAAIALDGNHQKGLWLAGIAYQQRGNLALASARWQTLLPLLPAGSGVADTVRQQLAAVAKNVAPSAPEASPETAAASLTVALDVSAERRAQFAPDTVVFLAVRDRTQPGPPLAAKRLTLGELPLELALSDADAMMPGRNLSTAQALTVVARISPSGQALTQADDVAVSEQASLGERIRLQL